MMNEFKQFFKNKRNLIATASLVIMLLILPLGIYLAQIQNIFFSQAEGTYIQVADQGNCVTTDENGEKALKCGTVPLVLYNPFAPSPEPEPAQTNLPVQTDDPAETESPTALPPAPTGLVMTTNEINLQNSTCEQGRAEVGLSWAASPGAVSYNVYRSYQGEAFGQIGTSQALTYLDVAVEKGRIANYRVNAVNSAGESAASNELQVNVKACPTFGPNLIPVSFTLNSQTINATDNAPSRRHYSGNITLQNQAQYQVDGTIPGSCRFHVFNSSLSQELAVISASVPVTTFTTSSPAFPVRVTYNCPGDDSMNFQFTNMQLRQIIPAN